jgi:undecaprenyl-diphosphatase
MDWFDAAILGVVQGVSEFLPISSSGHLVIAEEALGLHVSSLKSFDVALHLGTLVAILIYFWKDIWGMIRALGRVFIGRFEGKDEYTSLIGYILIGTVPAVVVGVLWGDVIDEFFRNPLSVAYVMIGTGVLFLVAEEVNKRVKASGLNSWRALAMGLFQAMALIPGISRSGSTISAGLLGGMSREKAARFSFLLGAPAMFGAGLWTYLDQVGGEVVEFSEIGANVGYVDYFPFNPVTFGIGFVVSALVGLVAVWGLMKFLKKYSLRVFAYYLFAVGILTYLGVEVF